MFLLSGFCILPLQPAAAWSSYDRGDLDVCKNVRCKKPPLLPNMLLVPLKGHKGFCYARKVRYICDCARHVEGGGVSECTYALEWSPVARCADKTCPNPRELSNATKTIINHVYTHQDAFDDKFCPLSKVHYQCSECLEGGGESMCQVTKRWSTVPKCTKIPGCKLSEYHLLLVTLRKNRLQFLMRQTLTKGRKGLSHFKTDNTQSCFQSKKQHAHRTPRNTQQHQDTPRKG